MRRICSWCGREMQSEQNDQGDESSISYGMCDKCAFHLLVQRGMKLKKFLDVFPFPVFIIDKDNRVKASNTKAAETFGKDHIEMDEILCGPVFECSHSYLPEGCGKTVHCSGCTVRICIEKTIETGQPLQKIPAYLDCTTENRNKVHFLVSTEKFGDAVLLKVEDISGLDVSFDNPATRMR